MHVFLIILLSLVGVLFVLVVAAPKKYRVSRSITINRPITEVYNYLRHSKNQSNWSPWQNRDPEMKQSYSGEDGTIGFTTKWESDHKQVGHGEQEIMSLENNKRIETALRFLKPWKSESMGFYDFDTADSNSTKVVWGFNGVHKIPLNVMMLFYNMDKAVGKDFEEGLSKLKEVLESK